MDSYHFGPLVVFVVLPAFEAGLLGMSSESVVKAFPFGAAGLFDANFCPASWTIDNKRWPLGLRNIGRKL